MTTYTALIFTGPRATHHLTDPEGWVMRESYLLRAAREHGAEAGELLSNREMAGKTELTGPAVINVRPEPAKAVLEASGDARGRCPGVNDRPRCGCGESITRNDWSAGVRRCAACRPKRDEPDLVRASR